nr:GNAT family N-acetyltransferase [Lactococcus insecticola]
MRQAQVSDLPEIMAIIAQARDFLGAQGIDQWQNAYPAQSDIAADITAQVGYVLIHENSGQIAGYAAVLTGFDKIYSDISDGYWLNDNLDYVMIHRTAVSSAYRGQKLGQAIFEEIMTTFSDYTDFRCDTHPENQIMQHILTKLGFEKRGTVQYEGPRYAYQKIVKEDK